MTLHKGKIQVGCKKHENVLADSGVGDLNKDGELVIAPGEKECRWCSSSKISVVYFWPEVGARAFWSEEEPPKPEEKK